MDAFESGGLDLPDLYFTGDDYRYRFQPEAKEMFLDLLREWFNSAVSYNGRALKWDTVIEKKTDELGRYLVGRTDGLDFLQPFPSLHRIDDKCLRGRIVSLTPQEAQRLGIGKGTFHYLRENARSGKSLTVYRKTQIDLVSCRRG
jgi:CRISPR-associated protein Cas1